MTSSSPYSCLLQIPSAQTYQRLRTGSGLSAKTHEAAVKGLPNSLFAVQVLAGDEVIGMGRVIGDGGCFYQVTDIAVLKAHQGRGVGKMIMREVMRYLEAAVPESGYVSLIADGKAHALYAQFGFVPTAPASVGMAYQRTKARASFTA